ncbi:DUF1516 family protein [Terrilactibacillus sp. BCM23-1]|uniref:DUF1516 family protein n=1 Tax=Terrilactibacillus tamarindi TaxID=2599694 RepID=A0A6N8CLC2_9BACI|nr:DUF1516 family protein [Terrilactibacillus tamarindi]MTT30541.1 DUF1516 family protein [Terrilactibacillus tamarindi]
MVYIHVASWTILLILFFFGFVLTTLEVTQGKKIVHLLTRIFYIVVFLTGLHLVTNYGMDKHDWVWPIIKMCFGLLVILSIEGILVRLRKQKRTSVYWVIFAVGLTGTFGIGYGILN